MVSGKCRTVLESGTRDAASPLHLGLDGIGWDGMSRDGVGLCWVGWDGIGWDRMG